MALAVSVCLRYMLRPIDRCEICTLLHEDHSVWNPTCHYFGLGSTASLIRNLELTSFTPALMVEANLPNPSDSLSLERREPAGALQIHWVVCSRNKLNGAFRKYHNRTRLLRYRGENIFLDQVWLTPSVLVTSSYLMFITGDAYPFYETILD